MIGGGGGEEEEEAAAAEDGCDEAVAEGRESRDGEALGLTVQICVLFRF
jgi:hypothetical protein